MQTFCSILAFVFSSDGHTQPESFETAYSDRGVTYICILSVSGGQQRAKVMKKVSQLSEGSQHSLTARKIHSAGSKILTMSPAKNKLENKQASQAKKQRDSQTNSQPANKEKECKKKLHLEGKAVTEAEGETMHHLWKVMHGNWICVSIVKSGYTNIVPNFEVLADICECVVWACAN